jgi:hypothetical protein
MFDGWRPRQGASRSYKKRCTWPSSRTRFPFLVTPAWHSRTSWMEAHSSTAVFHNHRRGPPRPPTPPTPTIHQTQHPFQDSQRPHLPRPASISLSTAYIIGSDIFHAQEREFLSRPTIPFQVHIHIDLPTSVPAIGGTFEGPPIGTPQPTTAHQQARPSPSTSYKVCHPAQHQSPTDQWEMERMARQLAPRPPPNECLTPWAGRTDERCSQPISAQIDGVIIRRHVSTRAGEGQPEEGGGTREWGGIGELKGWEQKIHPTV